MDLQLAGMALEPGLSRQQSTVKKKPTAKWAQCHHWRPLREVKRGMHIAPGRILRSA
jgi:hypothetical protein